MPVGRAGPGGGPARCGGARVAWSTDLVSVARVTQRTAILGTLASIGLLVLTVWAFGVGLLPDVAAVLLLLAGIAGTTGFSLGRRPADRPSTGQPLRR